MGISVYNIAEQVRGIIGASKAEYQEIVQQVKNCYASVALKYWYAGKLEGVSELSGNFMYTFKNLAPELDIDINRYYIMLPSTYVNITHDMGINTVSYMKGQDKPFVRFPSGFFGLIATLKSASMGGNQTFEIDGNKMYFPYMRKKDVADIFLRLAIAFGEDVDEELNISPSDANEIITMVVARLNPVAQVKPDTLIK